MNCNVENGDVRPAPRAKKKRGVGRPSKYDYLLAYLEDNEVYTPAKIVQLAFERNLIEVPGDVHEQHKLRVKIRHCLARKSVRFQFPDEGDGTIKMPGQAPVRGWFGSRWKQDPPSKQRNG
ncbi:hypothetical protein [Acanthopleuribacter pedis]|uniref:Uncharacterized protein n=1 Tax=Acanthopleuribacter pedis TaxID=442870 RepID=A0A8J7Q7B6_9BACT|nr:hypothetical protein [Acanthopleuribacter pedis]MBO1321982.1 hypothetical protein [Acanthopleuribacter pedis]